MYILAINPGSTSTKISVYNGLNEVFTKNLKHSVEELAPFHSIIDQYEFRKNIILNELKENNIEIKDLKAVMGRGGLIKPIPGGVYHVNDALIADLRKGLMGEHASNLGGIIANEIAKEGESAQAFIVDPVVVDELEEIARLSGHPDLPRVSIFHALNQKAVARRYARELGKKYEELNLIVAHLGGGISVGAHKLGKVIDVNNALNGDGPFSPERTGGLPAWQLAQLCFSEKYTASEVKKLITGNGGCVAYLGTNDAYKVECMAKDGDKKAELVFEAMAYQVSKDIGACAAVLCGKVDAIIITGGIARGKGFCEWIRERVEFIAKVIVVPGEDEMSALAEAAYYALQGEMAINEYK